MLCLSGFELYSRWVPLNYTDKNTKTCKTEWTVSFSFNEFFHDKNCLTLVRGTNYLPQGWIQHFSWLVSTQINFWPWDLKAEGEALSLLGGSGGMPSRKIFEIWMLCNAIWCIFGNIFRIKTSIKIWFKSTKLFLLGLNVVAPNIYPLVVSQCLHGK